LQRGLSWGAARASPADRTGPTKQDFATGLKGAEITRFPARFPLENGPTRFPKTQALSQINPRPCEICDMGNRR